MSEGKKRVPFDQACEFVVEVAVAAHACGCSTPRLETFLTALMTSFGYGGVFLATPNQLIFAFSSAEGSPQRIHMLAPKGAGLNLDRLARIGGVVDAVTSGRSTISDAGTALREIGRSPDPWGHAASAIAYASVGAGVAGVLMGSWWDIAVAIPLSLLVYGTVLLSPRLGPRGADWLPLTSALVAGVLAALAKVVVPELNVVLAVLSAIAVLLP